MAAFSSAVVGMLMSEERTLISLGTGVAKGAGGGATTPPVTAEPFLLVGEALSSPPDEVSEDECESEEAGMITKALIIKSKLVIFFSRFECCKNTRRQNSFTKKKLQYTAVKHDFAFYKGILAGI